MSAFILVMEVNPLYRDALVRLLGTSLGYPDIAATASIDEGVRVARAHPELSVMLYDPGAAAFGGLDTIAVFRRYCARLGVVALLAPEDRLDPSAVLRAGANATVSKNAPIDTLTDTVRRVFNRARDETGHILPHTAAATVVGPVSPLTPRQRDVLALLAEGHPNKRIGLKLGLAEITVKMHVSSIFRVLGVTNRTQAVVAARRLGLHTALDVDVEQLAESRQT